MKTIYGVVFDRTLLRVVKVDITDHDTSTGRYRVFYPAQDRADYVTEEEMFKWALFNDPDDRDLRYCQRLAEINDRRFGRVKAVA